MSVFFFLGRESSGEPTTPPEAGGTSHGNGTMVVHNAHNMRPLSHHVRATPSRVAPIA